MRLTDKAVSRPGMPLPLVHTGEALLARIAEADAELEAYFRPKLKVEPSLTRRLVSFQDNKNRPAYRWFRYKEGFSAALVQDMLRRCGVHQGPVLDPFAGSGTTLFAARDKGLEAHGIELLPIGQEIIAVRLLLEDGLTDADRARLAHWLEVQPWRESTDRVPVPAVRITEGAYPPETERAMEQYLAALQREPEAVQKILRFALLCVLEDVSYTRKDGQYLRWDHRSGHTLRSTYEKSIILPFDIAITAKLAEILADTEERTVGVRGVRSGPIQLFCGSLFTILPTLPDGKYQAVMTSPPYLNRYDYTRTYALELAILGSTDKDIAALRQEMLSATVENREKDLLALNPDWKTALEAAERCELLQLILRYLEDARAAGSLNNTNIPRMVRGYFYEMACVIQECARILAPGAPFIMVNDNVRYAGVSISVDLILSRIAEDLGFEVEAILVLPTDKGNSSQQMGRSGRQALRKNVYVWRKR